MQSEEKEIKMRHRGRLFRSLLAHDARSRSSVCDHICFRETSVSRSDRETAISKFCRSVQVRIETIVLVSFREREFARVEFLQ